VTKVLEGWWIVRRNNWFISLFIAIYFSHAKYEKSVEKKYLEDHQKDIDHRRSMALEKATSKIEFYIRKKYVLLFHEFNNFF
jgi:hypothetical protein